MLAPPEPDPPASTGSRLWHMARRRPDCDVMASTPDRRTGSSDDWSTRRTKGSSLRSILDAATRSEAEKQRLVQSSNWRTPIIVDTSIGVVIGVIGLILAIIWSPLPGGAIGAAGLTYAAMAISRGRRWQRLREDAEA